MSSRDRTIQVKAERLIPTTGQLFEELMATFHTLGIADPPLELHVLGRPRGTLSHCVLEGECGSQSQAGGACPGHFL